GWLGGHPTAVAPPGRGGSRGGELAAAGLLALALGWAYAPSLAYLARIWAGDPNYSHGYFIIPIALGILYLRRDKLDRTRVAPSWWGWAALAAVLALRAYLYERNLQWLEDATVPLAVAALVLALGGWPLLRWALPAVAFLGFMLPLPHRFNVALAYPLQKLATDASCGLLQMAGLPVVAD